MTTNTQVEELRGVVDKLLSMMKVEEYGVVPQSETLNKIMDLFTHQLELAKIEAKIETCQKCRDFILYDEKAIDDIDRLSWKYKSELTKQKEELLNE